VEGRATPSGWYADPQGRFELRYFNGVRWTSDVAVNGRRYVDTVATPPPNQQGSPPRRPRGMAIAAFVTALAAVVIGWVPFIFALAACSAVVAIVFGVIGLNTSRRHDGHGRGFAVAALVLAPIGLAVCVGGFFFTRAVLHELGDFVDPGPHELVIQSCTGGGSSATIRGTIRNDDTRAHEYRIVVQFGNGTSTATATVAVPLVEAGETTPWATAAVLSGNSVSCRVSDVFGPLPFGVDQQG
jgi:hypothetical protein